MHRSRLSTILIDSPTDSVAQSAQFWSSALGVPATPVPDEEQFVSLAGALPELTLAVQSVDDAPRYHVDIETDNVEAETARLIDLGAVEVSQWMGCRSLRVPGGQIICVIPQHSDPELFARLANEWP
jgi:hypothetical protein